MTLIACKECKKEVSTLATTCPNCGSPVSKPIKKGEAIAGWFVIATFLAIGYFIYSQVSGTSTTDQERANNKQKEDACKVNLQCSGDKYQSAAEVECRQRLDAQAKSIAKWDFKLGEGGLLDFLLQRFSWVDDSKKQIIYFGDKAKFQNGFGAWQRVEYQCVFDTQTKKAVDSSFHIPEQ